MTYYSLFYGESESRVDTNLKQNITKVRKRRKKWTYEREIMIKNEKKKPHTQSKEVESKYVGH